jgi:hypothetical protein
VVKLGRVWYTDDNAIVRQKVDEAVVKQRAPLLSAIVRQGVQEGVFTTAYPDQAGEVILSLLQGMGNTHAKLLLTSAHEIDEAQLVAVLVTTHAAYMEAIERVLGAPSNSLVRTDVEAVNTIFCKIRVLPYPCYFFTPARQIRYSQLGSTPACRQLNRPCRRVAHPAWPECDRE